MAARTRSSYPNQAFGYWRGAPLAGGQGSGAGMANQGVGILPAGMNGLAGSWEPSVLYLLGLVVVEMFAFHLIGRLLK